MSGMKARLEPVSLETADREQREILDSLTRGKYIPNVFGTLARKPDAAKAYLAWGSYVLRRSAFDPALRELAILRVGYLCRSNYEWAQHSMLARQAGLSNDQIENVKNGSDASGWTDEQKLVLAVADEAVTNHNVRDALWAKLIDCFGEESTADLIYVLGHYIQTSLFLNSFGVQLDPGQKPDPDFADD